MASYRWRIKGQTRDDRGPIDVPDGQDPAAWIGAAWGVNPDDIEADRIMTRAEALRVAMSAMDDRASELEEEVEANKSEEAKALTAAYLVLGTMLGEEDDR